MAQESAHQIGYPGSLTAISLLLVHDMQHLQYKMHVIMNPFIRKKTEQDHVNLPKDFYNSQAYIRPEKSLPMSNSPKHQSCGLQIQIPFFDLSGPQKKIKISFM